MVQPVALQGKTFHKAYTIIDGELYRAEVCEGFSAEKEVSQKGVGCRLSLTRSQ